MFPRLAMNFMGSGDLPALASSRLIVCVAAKVSKMHLKKRGPLVEKRKEERKRKMCAVRNSTGLCCFLSVAPLTFYPTHFSEILLSWFLPLRTKHAAFGMTPHYQNASLTALDLHFGTLDIICSLWLWVPPHSLNHRSDFNRVFVTTVFVRGGPGNLYWWFRWRVTGWMVFLAFQGLPHLILLN